MKIRMKYFKDMILINIIMNHLDNPDPEEDFLVTEEIELGEWAELINVFLTYYKDHYETPEDFNMFTNTDLDKLDSTNRPMEIFYQIIEEYKLIEEREPELNTIFELSEVDFDKNPELQILIIDQVPVMCCGTLFPLLKYMAERDWSGLDWKINKIEQGT